MDTKGRDWYVVVDRDSACMLRLDPESDGLNKAVQGPLAFRDGPMYADGTQMAIVLNDEGANLFEPTMRVGGNQYVGAPHIAGDPWPWMFGRAVVARWADGRLCGLTENEAYDVVQQQSCTDLFSPELLASAVDDADQERPVLYHSWGAGALPDDLVALAGDDPILFPETR